MRSLRFRIAVSALVGAVVLVAIVIGGVVISANLLAHGQVAQVAAQITESQLAECRENPGRWHHVEGVLLVWAYDVQGQSANPNAPLWVEPLPTLGAAPRVISHHSWPIRYWQAIRRVDQDGPCALLLVDGPERLPLLVGIRRAGLGAMLLGIVFVLAGTLLVAVRPLLSRISRLAIAAHRVGEAGAFPEVDANPDELGDVSRALAAAHTRIARDRHELARRHQVLEQHLASVAHDLRTPLAALQLTLEALADKVPESAESDVGDARMEVAYLEALADNLHHASRLSGGLDVTADDACVDLGVVVRRVAMRFDILGRTRQVEVVSAVPDASVLAHCDAASAERAIANLVHNALVHGPTNHPVGIALDLTEAGFRLTVSSGGPVLEEAVVQRLQVRRLTDVQQARTRHGDGLGVAIVNEVAQRAGWSTQWIAAPLGGLQVVLTGTVSREP